jgi:outer membrane phospholipase A
VSVSDVGFAVVVGGGLEIPLNRRLAIVPAVDWVQQFYSGGREVIGYRERLLHVGIGVLFQTAH